MVHSKNPPSEPDLARAIVLNDAENAFALQGFDKTTLRSSFQLSKPTPINIQR